MVGPDKQLKTAEIFEQIDLLDYGGRGYIQGFSGFAKGTQVYGFDKGVQLMTIHGRPPVQSLNFTP